MHVAPLAFGNWNNNQYAGVGARNWNNNRTNSNRNVSFRCGLLTSAVSRDPNWIPEWAQLKGSVILVLLTKI